MRAVLLALLLATPALADPIQGLDDPAFRAPFERALQSDDPTALKDLHAAAEAGNQAAILALPVVSQWLHTTLPFSERKLLARVNGVPVAEAFTAADPTAALWAMGEPSTDMDALLTRAFSLYAAGEADKGTFLLVTWVNQTGGYGPLPPGLFDRPVPPWLMARVLQSQLQDITTQPEPAETLLSSLLRKDDLAGWIAMAAYAGLNRPDYAPLPQPTLDRIARILAASGHTQEEGQRKMQEAAMVLRSFARSGDATLDPAAAKAATEAFRAEPEFQPLLTLCASACPATADQCTTAFVATFGHPYGRTTPDQPLTSLISTKDFFATPRGRLLLLRSTLGALGEDPATSPTLAAARQIDACLADSVLAAVP
jgi:hypothetical protein